jgi:hypothetical protein
MHIKNSLVFALIAATAFTVTSCSSGRPVSRYPDSRNPDRRIIIVDRDDDHSHRGRGRGHYEHGRGRGYGHSKHGDYRIVRVRRPLIIIRTPDIIIGRYSDGRNYYRNQDGFMYWEGRDNRYYLDEQYIDRIEYNDNEYNDWRARGDRNYQSGNGNGNYRRDNNYDNRQDNDNNNNRNGNHGQGKKKGNGHGRGKRG